MFKYKQLFVGFFVGAFVMTASSGFADTVITRVDAYLNPEIPVILNGNQVNLDSPPAIIDGSTYLKLRDAAKLTGLQVDWNENTRSIELNNTILPSNDASIQEMIFYNATDVNAKYPPTESKVLSNGHIIWVMKSGKEIDQQELLKEKDKFYIDGTNQQYWSKEYFLNYLTEDDLSPFQKYTINRVTKTVTPIK